jgi:predicted transcriptional regulator
MKKLILEILATGMTQKEVAREIGLSQAAVSFIARGVTQDPRGSVCDAIRKLHAERTAKRKAA